MSWQPCEIPDVVEDEDSAAVDLEIIPRTADIGGYEVHRALPSAKLRMVGPFIFFDQMGPGEFLSGKGLDVRPHPHIGLATVTYLFDGSIRHQDSLGFKQDIQVGDVNLMTAGRGIVHSERTAPELRQQTNNLFGIQSWLALPKDQEERTPDFAHTDKAALPLIEDKGMSVRIVMGSLHGKTSPVQTYSQTVYADFTLQAGQSVPIPADAEERAIYLLSGKLEISGTAFDPMQLLVLHPKGVVSVKALQDSRFVLIGGEAMDEQRYIWWNFVSSSKERIEQAKADWQQKRFAMVDGDPEFIPLPDKS